LSNIVYGGYTHADDSAGFTINEQMILSPRGTPFKKLHSWIINGVLRATTQSQLTAEMDALKAAYSQGGQDLVFNLTGGVGSHHRLLSGSTLTGTRVRRFTWLDRQPGVWGSGTEYVFRRSYQIVVDAEAIADGADNILQYTQSITYKGYGGPRWILAGSLTGAMQAQTVQAFTPFYAIQSGFALGLFSRPSFPGPLWPALEHGEMREETEIDGTPYANGTIALGARWRYVHESSAAIV